MNEDRYYDSLREEEYEKAKVSKEEYDKVKEQLDNVIKGLKLENYTDVIEYLVKEGLW